MHGAVYDAVNAIDGGYQPYYSEPDADPLDSQAAAAIAAASTVLMELVPSQAGAVLARRTTDLGLLPDGEAKENGIVIGDAAGQTMLDRRADDGRLPPGTPYPFALGTAAGAWRVSPPLTAVEGAWWVGDVTPFLMLSPDQFRSDGPDALTSAAYAADFNEVKSVGSLTASPTMRSEDQTTAAIFWQAQPWGLYGGVLRTLSSRYELTTAENARLFAMVGFAAADGAIACWNDKYYWKFWRPLDAIRLAGTDGNPDTVADPDWKALFDPSTPVATGTAALATPNFPDHPSGHSCVSSAIVNAMQEFFGTDKIEFNVFSPRFPGVPRHFDRFSHVLKEIIDARVWGGIHFRTADTQGAVIGKKVAHWERKHYFQPVG